MARSQSNLYSLEIVCQFFPLIGYVLLVGFGFQQFYSMIRYRFIYLVQGWQSFLNLWLNVFHQFLARSSSSPSAVLLSPSLTPITHILVSLPVFPMSLTILCTSCIFVPPCVIGAAFFWPTFQSTDTCSLTCLVSSLMWWLTFSQFYKFHVAWFSVLCRKKNFWILLFTSLNY